MEATEVEEVTTNSQLVGILPGDLPTVNLVDYVTGRNGVKRHFTQQVSVLDEDLFVRFQQEAKIGEQIRVTLVNEYHETKIVTYVSDFQKIIKIVSNGARPNGANSMIAPVLLEKTTVRN